MMSRSLEDDVFYTCGIMSGGGGVDLSIDRKIRVCCYTRDESGTIADIPDRIDNYCELINKIKNKNNEIIEYFQQGKIHPACLGCFYLTNTSQKPKKIDKLKMNTISLNYYQACNLNCIFCHKVSKKYNQTKHEEADHKNILNLIKQIVEHSNISDNVIFGIGGGEPSISVEMVEIVEYLLENDLHVNLNTNAARYVEAFADGAMKGLINLYISIDAGSEEIFKKIKRADGFENAWNNIGKYMQKTNDNVRIKFILLPENVDDIDNMVEKCKEYNVRTVLIDLLSPKTDADTIKQENSVFIEHVQALRHKLQSIGVNVEKGYFMPDDVFTQGEMEKNMFTSI